ncbi:MAG TPA: tripartite tricarboxylate transporter substrate-binding protein, partial [Ramlibacter sp.]|nr:tripartite tricarboxylate transporter substrate-binding protein [Ramlibacter sp.]
QAIRGGQVDIGVDILGPVMGQIQQKALHPLAVLGDKRPPQLPNVAAAREAGGPLANFNVSSWNGLAVPAKTPAAVIERLNKEVGAALARPEVRQKLADLSLNPQHSTPQQAAQHLAADVKRWGEVIERAKIPKQ